MYSMESNPMSEKDTPAETKNWFSYEFGYVNLDAGNLYLTNSGNWSETVNLDERSRQTSHKPSFRIRGMKLYFILCLAGIGFLLLRSLINDGRGIKLVFLACAGVFFLYRYLRTEMGPRFRIPLNKITSIEISGNNIRIAFLDKEGGTDHINLKNVDKKGLLSIEQYRPVRGDDGMDGKAQGNAG